MFGIFASKKKKNAKALLSMAYKVYNYRCDVMAEGDAKSLYGMIEEIESLLDDGKIDSKEYKDAADRLEKLMQKVGGTIYPGSGWTEFVDTVVVVGILVIGIRAFFLQPFKIPTNSMYPSFYGMTSEVFNADNPAPNLPERLARLVFKGASNYSLEAPESGEFMIEINPPDLANKRGGLFAFETVPVNKYFVWPSTVRRYSFKIGNRPLDLAVPADFSLDTVIPDAFPIAGAETLSDYFNKAHEEGKLVRDGNNFYLKLGEFKKGQSLINFDILSGDMLFVDRVTYNFRKPRVGEAFVFRTKGIDGMTRHNGGVPDDKYYIKRIVGAEGDTLKVDGNTLLVNGEPAKGSVAFEANAKREGGYSGYRQEGALADGKTVTVRPKHFYAMGDNSANSWDSRYWGQVPQDAVVGKSLIIFYPFTKRWGASK